MFVKTAVLVGGFSASPWLYERLLESLQTIGIDLSRPNNHAYVPLTVHNFFWANIYS